MRSRRYTYSPVDVFSPLAFPNGVILYDLSTSGALEAQQGLFPFELHRTQLVILGLLDGSPDPSTSDHAVDKSEPESTLAPERMDHHQKELESQFPHALLIQLIVFNHSPNIVLKHALTVPPKHGSRSTTIKTVMCDVSAKLLSEMSVFAKAIQAENDIASPIIVQPNDPAPYLRRHNSLRQTLSKGSSEEMHPSNFSDPGENAVNAQEGMLRRASSPTQTSVAPSSQPRERPRSPTSRQPASDHNRNHTVDLARRSTDALARIKDSERNRSSVHGMPSITPTERAKNVNKLRQGLILGTLYLLAGRWPDALRDLVDNTTRAKVFADHFWYAKGMENILITMLLLTWARMDFTIPPICFSGPERPASLKHIPSANLVRTSQSTDSDDGLLSRTLSNLTMVLPEIINCVAQHYRREDGVDPSKLAQLPFSESIIRLSYLMAVMQRTGGQLTEKTVRFLVLGSPSFPLSRSSQCNLGTAHLHNADIAGLIFQAFPLESSANLMPLDDIIGILSGIISVLSTARLYRKRAMIIREAISLLIPRLIQARKVGAAEMGIHPASSLAARHGLIVDSISKAPILSSRHRDIQFHDLLAVLCETFGVSSIHTPSNSKRVTANVVNSSDAGEMEQMQLEALQRLFGGFELKAEILRLCANFSESLPDFQSVIRFTTALLRVAGPGSAPKSDSVMPPIRLPKDDQLRFATKISRTLSVFKAEDATKLESEYWDPFIVRDVAINISASPNVISINGQLHCANLIRQTTHHDLGNAHAVNTAVSINTIAAGETTELLVTLQNLYDFDLSIESLDIVTDDSIFESQPASYILAPRSIQQVAVSGVASTLPAIYVRACRVKVQGCRKQDFPLYRNPWSPIEIVKIKSTGLKSLSKALQGALLSEPAKVTSLQKSGGPVTRKFQVVAAQAKLVFVSSTLPHGPTDLMDGESKAFSVTVKNLSNSTTVNFMHVSMDYEYDKEAHKEQSKITTNAFKDWVEPITWQPGHGLEPVIPGGAATLHLRLLGQIGLLGATLRIDYANYDRMESVESSCIYGRRLLVPLSCVVNPTIQVEAVQPLLKQQLAAFDVVNLYESPLTVDILPHDAPASGTSTIEANKSTRIVLPLHSLSDACLSAPWYAQFSTPSSSRCGRIRIEPDKLAPLIVRPPSVAPVNLLLMLHDAFGSPISTDKHCVHTLAREESFKLHATLENTTNSLQKAVLQFRLRASGLRATTPESEEGVEQLAWTGSLKRGAKLGPSEGKVFELTVSALASGLFEVEGEVSLRGEPGTVARNKHVFRVQDSKL